MGTTISNGTDTLTPELVDGWEPTREARTIVHTILGSNQGAVTLRPHALRSGTLAIVVGTDAAIATALESLLTAGDVLTLADTEQPTVNMSFVVSGRVEGPRLDDETREVWLIDAEFQEVAS
jgi:hypothetical protein